MNRIFLSFIILLTTIEFQNCNNIEIELNKFQDYYVKNIVKTKFVSEIDLKVFNHDNIKIQNVRSIDNNLDVKIISHDRKKRKKHSTLLNIFIKPNSKLNARQRIMIKDSEGKKYYLTLNIYSKEYNIDSLPNNFEISYRMGDYRGCKINSV